MTDLHLHTATHLRGALHAGQLSAREVVEAHLRQIEHINPTINAICTLDADRALERAAELDEEQARGGALGPLHGLPIAIKDLVETKGMRTTLGSRIYQDLVPDYDQLFVERLRAAGAVILGKTNTPELGAGSHTFNQVFGVTRNPWDPTRTAGGSSGGGAAALAARMLPIADGSDLGGSVRNPPSFNNVFGLRPSPGRIPQYPKRQTWSTLPVLGPMARTVEDAALLLSVMAGPDARDPISITQQPAQFLEPLERDLTGTRIAWSPDLGLLEVEPQVLEVLERALPVLEDLGCIVEPAHPDLAAAYDIFQVLRAHEFAAGFAHELERNRALMKDTVVWNIEKGLALSGMDVARAQAQRGQVFAAMRRFFERYDFLVLPTAQVAPFPVEVDWVRAINGVEQNTYVDWMMSCCLITTTEHPAASVPAGFTAAGLPVGMQIVGPFRQERKVLELASAFEQATRYWERLPGVLGGG